jgi:hypothetical protein
MAEDDHLVASRANPMRRITLSGHQWLLHYLAARLPALLDLRVRPRETPLHAPLTTREETFCKSATMSCKSLFCSSHTSNGVRHRIIAKGSVRNLLAARCANPRNSTTGRKGEACAVRITAGTGAPANSCVSTESTLAARSALCLAAVDLLAGTADVLVLRGLARWRFGCLLRDVRGMTRSFCCIQVVNVARALEFGNANLSKGLPSAVCS